MTNSSLYSTKVNLFNLLFDLRNRLLHLHQVLLDMERHTYNQVHGQVSSGELLQLVIYHEQFNWLHRLSELVVQIDEILRDDDPAVVDQVKPLLDQVRSLTTPSEFGNEFERNYYRALQQSPDAVLAHAAVVELLALKVVS